MRYVSLFIALILSTILASGCQEEKKSEQTATPQAAAEATAQAKPAAAPMDQSMQTPTEAMEHAKTEAHKAMDGTHEAIKEAHEGMKMAAAASTEMLASGQAVYEKSCAACHTAGIAGAPKLGDKEAWATRNADGLDELTHVAINGKGAMPAKGGNASLTDDEVRAAVNYMMEQGR
jgi:cytochrome c5